jgi:hypothetical protein
MPVWGWVLLIAVLGALAVGAVMAIVRATHRLPSEEPLHGDHTNFASPLPLDSLTERELEAEEASSRDRSADARTHRVR